MRCGLVDKVGSGFTCEGFRKGPSKLGAIQEQAPAKAPNHPV